MKFIRGWSRLVLLACVSASLIACGGESDEDGSAPTRSIGANPEKRALAVDTSKFTGNGWYWNPVESGTGFMFESQGDRAFVGFFMYDELSGNPIWYVAYGDMVADSLNGEFGFTGDLRVYAGGKPIPSSTYTSSTPSSTLIGQVQISFAAGKATVKLPGGRIMEAERFVIDGSGYDHANPVPRRSHQPETGWYWNPAEGGRGYAIEVQNDKIFMAVFHYNLDGSPTWNVVQGDIASGTTVKPFELYTGGQSITSAHRGGSRDELAPFTLSFRNACAGQMQLSGAPAILVRRFRIDGTDRPAGAECSAVSNGVFPATPGLQAGSIVMEPGDTVFGKINIAGELYAYGFNLQSGKTYSVSLGGAAAGAGTLLNPVLSVYDANLVEQQVARQSASSVSFTPGSNGVYYLTAKASGAETGYFILSVSGIASTLSSQPPPDVSAYAGTIAGSLSGRATGTFTLMIRNTGQATGTLLLTGNQSSSLSMTGQAASGGAITLVASGGGFSLTFSGFMAPDWQLFGTWGDGQGLGGMFRGSSTSPATAPVSGSSNGWVVTRSVSTLDSTVSCYLSKIVGMDPIFGLTARVGFNAPSFKPGSRSGFASFPQDDIEAPYFNISYCGGGACYATNSGLSLIKVDALSTREFFNLSKATLAAHQAAFIENSERILTTDQSPDHYQGLLDELAVGAFVTVRAFPTNRFFPAIEGTISLQGYTEMLTVFNRCSAGRPAGPP